MLTKLEKSKRTRENEVDFWALSDGKKLVWSIEHILPQNPSQDSDWDKIFSDEDKKAYVHRLGNLTLTCYNSSLSNKSYGKKISVTDKDEKNVGLKSGNVKINKYLMEKQDDTWKMKDIDARSDSLSKEILNLLKINIIGKS